MIHFADESFADIPTREALLDRVMGQSRFLKPSERLRRGRLPARGLSLVARDRDKVVGSVRLWNVSANGTPALLLGPLAVDRDTQGSGVGSGLMHLAIARARDLGHGGIILVGDPEYYERFGFSTERTSGLVMPAPVERRRFLGLELTPRGLIGAEGRLVATGEPASNDLAVAA
jgi:predicted N-acetyltransferase YhbS